MDEIRALLENLNQLSAEDLDKLRGLIVAEFERVDGEDVTAENVAALNELADAGDQVLADQARRETEQAEAEAARETARERITALNPPEEPEVEEIETPEAESEETPEAEAETPAEETPAEPVVASAKPTGKVAKMAARQSKPKASPEAAEPADPRTVLVASGLGYGSRSGEELDKDALARKISAALKHMPRPSGRKGSRGNDVLIASADWSDQYPDERRMTGDYESDERKWQQIASRDSLTASGGICSPLNVDYTIGMVATNERPIRQGLPATNVSRGGLLYRNDFDYSAANGAITVWTEATDASPAGATKSIATIACPGVQTSYVDAVVSRLGFGNMQAKFDPETVAAATDAAMVFSARTAENNLLHHIAAACTQNITNTQVLGATRDFITALGEIVSGFRNLHRLPDSLGLRALLPVWVKNLVRVDLARQVATAATETLNPLAVTDEQIEAFFQPYGVTPIWHIDGQAAGTDGVAVNQTFPAQATGATNKFPTSATWYLWYEGAFQLLDAGTLDLGIVRDSLLDATNDWELFSEIFETVIYRGFTGGAMQFNTTLCGNGGSAGTISTASACA